MNTSTNQFTIALDGTYRTIDNLSAPLASASSSRNANKAHLLRGR